jgi:arylsulfatase A-like enzyme
MEINKCNSRKKKPFMEPIAYLFLHISIIVLLICNKNVTAQGTDKKPNIVFILADDLGYGDLSCFGATRVQTPNMDRLAEEGMRFTNAYSPHSVSTPTRYALMTGRYAWRTWNGHITVWANDPLLVDTARTTLPDILQSSGYQTALIGKWHLGFGVPGIPGWDPVKGPDYNRLLKPGPLEVGFDYFYGIPHVGQKPHVFIENHHVVGLDEEDSMRIVLDKQWLDRPSYLKRIGVPAHQFAGNESARYEHEELAVQLTGKAVEWLEDEREEPFFLYFAHRNVHAPLKPNPRFAGTSEIGVYGDFINELDWSVGEILKALDREGLTDSTIVFLSSDNGGVKDYLGSKIIEYNGHRPNGPFFGQKTEAYEGGVHVPMIVRWPGTVEPGTSSDKLVSLTDVLATMAEFTNQPLDWGVGEDSFSFLNELQGRNPEQPVRGNVVVDATSGLMAIRKGPWKFIAGQGGGGVNWDEDSHIRMIPHKWHYPEDSDNPPGQLYNLEKDPGETNNLYYSRPEIVVRLKAKLREIIYSGRSR